MAVEQSLPASLGKRSGSQLESVASSHWGAECVKVNLHSGHDAELLVGDGESQRLVVEEALDVAGDLFNQTQAAL